MEKVQRLNVCGHEELSNSYDCLRYSLVPSEKMLLSSINRYNDSKRKCLDEYGINVHKAKIHGLVIPKV